MNVNPDTAPGGPRHRETLPVPARQFDPMTEAEARRVGHAATRVAQLRDLMKATGAGASFTVKTSNGAQSLSITSLEATACLALLIEREAAFLTSFGVQVEPLL